jgi:V/A-type H+/Na+-transporting ATPase subunit I
MSIVTLKKIVWCGLSRDKEKTLEALQTMGCLQIIPVAREAALREVAGPTQQAHDALKFLKDTSAKRRQVHNPEKFDAIAIEKEVLELRDALVRLGEEKDFLAGRIAALRPFGSFTFAPLEEMGGLRFWFFAVPHKDMNNVVSRSGAWKIVKKDNRFSYVVIIAKDEPNDMPVARIHTGAKPLAELEHRLEEVEEELEDLDDRKWKLSRWCDLYQRNLFLLENQALRSEVAQQTYDREQLFALQAWVPTKNLDMLRKAARDFHAALVERDPDKDEAVPTLLENPPLVAGGADLVTFYMTPGYRMWDPSVVVFFSFAVFFAMILSDAGYSLLMSLFLAWKWKGMSQSVGGRRMRNLLTALLGASVIWGIMVGSYFGMEPPAGSFLKKLKILDLNNSSMMMLLSLSIGVFHISLANVMDAWRKRRTSAVFTPLGWIGIIVGGFILALGSKESAAAGMLKMIGTWSMGIGASLLVLFAAPNPNIFKRIFGGISSLTRLSSAFGDVLSYLRLFALGLAGASLGATFNGLAKQTMDGMPGIGILFAFLIFLFGHVMNLVLSIVSCVVHGLRLNVIEFFNWSLYEDGRPFRPFAIKGGVPWNH